MGDTPVEEEKDPHYLAGKNHLNGMDYDGAIGAFEDALMANPKSAAAHLELGLLYEEKRSDYAAAIYHFERHLSLKPDSNMAETVKQRIYTCKLELAKTVSFALVSRQVQDEIRRLSVTNAALYEQVALLKTQLVEQATFYSNKLALAVQAAAPAPVPSTQASFHDSERRTPTVERSSPPPTARATPSRPAATATPTPRLHVVKQGETLATISKKYNIKLSTLQNINPSVDSRKLKAGQVLNLPTLKN